MRMPTLVLVLLSVAVVSVTARQQQAPPQSKPVGQTPSADRTPAQPSATLESVYAAAGPARLTADPDSPFAALSALRTELEKRAKEQGTT